MMIVIPVRRSTKESVWDLAVKRTSETNVGGVADKTLIFTGSKGSGKSTIIQRFLDRSDVIKETLALEYNFGRKSGRSLTKETCHVWELGGGTLFLNLLDLHLVKRDATLVLVLDLSSPETLWNVLETILTHAYNVLLKRKEDARRSSNARGDFVAPFPMPLIILGGKYDVYQAFEPDKRKVMCRALRSVAHSVSASLVFYSDKDATLVKKLRDVLHHHSFGGSQWKGHCVDYNKPLLVNAGSDSFDEIGVGAESLTISKRGLSLDQFKHTYTMVFPQEKSSDRMSVPDDPSKDPNFKEPLVDIKRCQKEEELDRYLAESERRKMSANGVFDAY